MSVINKMLQDLDQRQALQSPAASLSNRCQFPSSADSDGGLWRRIPWLTITVVLGGATLLWFEQGSPPADRFYVLDEAPVRAPADATVATIELIRTDQDDPSSPAEEPETGAKARLHYASVDHREVHALDFWVDESVDLPLSLIHI